MNLKPFISLIEEFEGLRLKAYLCPAKVWTIGYGTTVYPDGKKVKRGDVITKERAIDLLLWDVAHERLPTVKKSVKAPLQNNELCALLSLCYNIGNRAFARSSVVKHLNLGSPKRVIAEKFLLWNKGGGKVLKGLVRRREAEVKLFLTPSEPVVNLT